MIAFWSLLALIVAFAGYRYRQRLKRSVIDDEAINRIIDEGRLTAGDDEDALDLDAASDAEDEFWSEYWDEPDEYQQ